MSEDNNCRFDWLISFILGMAGMLLILVTSGLFAGGQYAIVRGDQMNNYIPAIRNLCRDIVNGEDAYYTWTYGLGINTALFNAYYAMSPMNIIYLLFYNADMNVVTTVSVIIKTGLAAMCFQLYLSKSHKVTGIISIIYSLFYSMSAFQVALNIHNIIWLDALIVLPVVFMCIDMLISEGRWRLLTIAYAFIFISNFYMGYMIGIASFIYYILSIILYRKELLMKRTLGRYAIAVVLAIGWSAFVWLPALLFLRGNSSLTASGFSELKRVNILDIYNQLLWGQVSNFDAVFPYVYVGIPSLLVAPLFWMRKEERISERLKYGILLVILLLSCLLPPLYGMWHGFDSPDSYCFRFSYIISFVLCTAAAKATKDIVKINKWFFAVLIAINVVVYAVEMFWQRQRVGEELLSANAMFLVVNFVLMTLWAVGLIRYSNKEATKQRKKRLGSFLVALTVCECCSNGYVLLRYENRIGSMYTKAQYNEWYGFEQWITNTLSEDKGMYRISVSSESNPSAGAFWGYNSPMYFSSAENVNLRNTMKKLGVWSTPRNIMNYGMNSALEMLLGIKYKTEIALQEVNGEVVPVNGIVYNENALSIGYMVEGTAEDYVLPENNAFDNMNSLLTTMTGDETGLYKLIDYDDIKVIEDGISETEKSDGYEICLSDNKNNPTLTYEIEGEGNIYAYVINEESYYAPDVFFLEDDPDSLVDTNGATTVSYMHELTKRDGKSVLTIVPGKDCDTETVKGIAFAHYDEENLAKVYEKLSSEQLIIDRYKDGYIHGTIDISSDKRLLFLSVPYEKGWTVKLDGKKIEPKPVVDGAFMAVDIQQEGQHEIELIFEAPGKRAGGLISIISVVIFFITVLKQNNLTKTLRKLKIEP